MQIYFFGQIIQLHSSDINQLPTKYRNLQIEIKIDGWIN